jgi:hypothetical protein
MFGWYDGVLQHKTIESVLQRGEKLDNLVERSQALSSQTKMFYKTAKKVSIHFYVWSPRSDHLIAKLVLRCYVDRRFACIAISFMHSLDYHYHYPGPGTFITPVSPMFCQSLRCVT